MRDLPHACDSKIRLLDSELVKALPHNAPESLYEAARHLLTASGKKIRPVLTLLSCEAVGGKIKDALNIAIAIELIHVASLIHDDILDGDNIRRGKGATHRIWGTRKAIMAGDVLYGKAVEIATGTGHSRILNLIARATVEMCEGESLEMELQENLEAISEEMCLKIIKKKTASLIRVAAESGAIIGGGSEDLVNSMSKYGELVGMAYQIRDDVLNFISTRNILKKPAKTDLLMKRPNLVLFHSINYPSSNAIRTVQEIAKNFSEMAKSEIKKLELEHRPKKALETLADFASQRVC